MLDAVASLFNRFESRTQKSRTPTPRSSSTQSISPSSHSSSSRPSQRSARLRKMAPLSPRSSNYERLEGGMGPSGNGGRKFGWKRFAIGAVVLFGLVWFFGPREPRQLSWGSKSPVTYPPYQADVDTNPLPGPPMPPVHSERPDDDIAAERPPPTSPSTDPDPLKTVYCSTPNPGSTRLVQYALMIDAGSTGSRIHIYKFNNCGPSAMYEYEVFKMIQPGLSSPTFSEPMEAAKSLDVLLDEAVRVVPESLRSCTPVAVKATAGLRLLGASRSEKILDAVRQRLLDKYPFPIKEDGVVIMEGKDEGVFAWITANYLLNTIRADTPTGTSSYAVLDLGGASTQIVFEPSFTKPDSSLADGEHKYDLTFGGKTHILYQHSYLGYGLMHARKSVHRVVDFMSSLRPSTVTAESVVGNPCLAKGTTRVVEVDDERTGVKRNVTMGGEDVGGFEACNRVIELVMAKDAICELKPCSFDGVYQPSLLDTFPSGKILLLSYFYDRMNPLLPKTNAPRITISSLASVAHDICLGRPSWEARWGEDQEVMDELEGRPEWCLDLTFMHALLRLGYEFDDDREVTLGKKINGTELGWCLGATIAMVGGELSCRI